MSINRVLHFLNDCVFHNKTCKIFETVKIKQLLNTLAELSVPDAALNSKEEVGDNNIMNDYNFNET